jgi:integrase
MALTYFEVENFRPRKKRYEKFDGKKGLYIRVAPSGLKTWFFRYHYNGVRKRMSLGCYPGVSLAKARELHSKAVQNLQAGIDPGEKKREVKQKHKAAPTFAGLLDEFWDMELGKTLSGKARRRLVEKDVLGPWGRRKVAEITRRDAVVLLDKVRERAPVTANRLQGVLARMFNFAAERGIINHSPLTGMRRGQEQSRSRVLTDEEIKLLWSALDIGNTVIDIYLVTKLALKTILLTGQRPGEVCGMEWSEIVDDFWIIPPERIKTRNSGPQRVPLCPMVIETLEQARVYSGESDFVFPSTSRLRRPVGRRTLSRAASHYVAELGFNEPFTPHDLRRTLRTKLAELGVKDAIAELVLGHKLQGILAVYNRHPYDEEKRQALTLWERRLQVILGVSQPANNVISFVGSAKNKNRG